MLKIIKITCTIIISSLLLSGCGSQNNLPLNPTTGSEFTDIWKEYDTYARSNNKAQLDFVSTSKLLDKQKMIPSDFTDNFSYDDNEIYIFTKFSHVFGTPISSIEIYEPSGKLYSRYKIQYTHKTSKWDIYTSIKVKDYPAADLSGLWSAKIIIDDKLAYIKKFTINNPTPHEKMVIPYQNIGVLPFWDAEKNQRKHSFDIANFLAQKFITTTKSNVILPTILQSEFSLPITNYESFLTYLEQDLKAERSNLRAIAQKYNIDTIITGRVLDDGIIRKDKGVDVYLIDVKNQRVREISRTTNATVTNLGMNEFNIKRDLYSKTWNELIEHILH